MFRTMRRFKQQISEEECIRILQEEKRGIHSMHGEDGYVFISPVIIDLGSNCGYIKQSHPQGVELFYVVTVGLEPTARKLYSRDSPLGRSLLKV